jgi:hypothetical protein
MKLFIYTVFCEDKIITGPEVITEIELPLAEAEVAFYISRGTSPPIHRVELETVEIPDVVS